MGMRSAGIMATGPEQSFLDRAFRVLGHYMPAWVALFFAVIPTLIGGVVERANRPQHAESQPRASERWGNNFAADVNLGLLSFWVWAVVTNAHDGRLVRSSGQRAGRQEERRHEFPAVLFFGMLTVVVYLLCKMQVHQAITFVLTALSVMLPALVLRLPQ
jgi:hypothetical protein